MAREADGWKVRGHAYSYWKDGRYRGWVQQMPEGWDCTRKTWFGFQDAWQANWRRADGTWPFPISGHTYETKEQAVEAVESMVFMIGALVDRRSSAAAAATQQHDSGVERG